MAIGDRVAVLVDGTVRQISTPRQLYAHPADSVVADFVSPAGIALVPATVVVASGLLGYRTGDRVLPTWAAPPAELAGASGRTVLLGIRAEDVHQRPQPEHGTLTGRVVAVQRTGPHTVVSIDVGGTVLTARFDGQADVRPRDAVTVGVDAAHALVFDAVTGAALDDVTTSAPGP